MEYPKSVCRKCRREFPVGYMVKRIDRSTGGIEDLCMWCAAETAPPGAFALEYPPHEGGDSFERGLLGMSERDYE